LRRALFDHVDLVVESIERSLPFYRDLLEPLGVTRWSETEGERGETIHYGGGPDIAGAIGLREKQSEGEVDRYAPGAHHVAFYAPSREVIDERAAWLRENGAEIESGPEEYDYRDGYYAVFFYDPDGVKLEIMTSASGPS
jgi:glyoxylase I family protein